MNYLRNLAIAGVACAALAQETADLSVIHRIKTEATRKGKVMEHLSALTDRYGPRLTASPEYDAAAEFVMTRYRDWGLSNIKAEKWGPFGRAWSLKNFSMTMLTPQYTPLIGFPLAWSASTPGVVKAEPVLLVLRATDLERMKLDIDKLKKEQVGKLKGKAVLMTAPPPLALQLAPPGRRFTDQELTQNALALAAVVPTSKEFDYSKLVEPEDPTERLEFTRNAPRAFLEAMREKRAELRRDLHDFLRKEGVAAVITTDRRGDGGTVFGESAGWYEAKYPSPLPSIVLTPEAYNRIARLTEKKVPVSLQFEIKAEISDTDVSPANVVAEIPGTSKADEIVLVGAHLDSWVGGTGATDNAAGCSVAMEAVRILKALNLPLERTVRVVLWSGEEQGLHGSKAYVKEHFGDPSTMQIKAGHEKVAAYFNLDNGSGKIRGVYLQGNDAARPVFERWLAPFRDQGVTTISIRDTGGTDHLSFDAVGIPGFQFIQDPLEYATRTHHSNMDTLDRVQGPDMIQASAVMASVLYHAANRAEKMPRKPLPEPAPKWAPAASSGSN